MKIHKVMTVLLTLVVLSICSAVLAVPTQMPSGFYFPNDRTTWTGINGGAVGDPKQPWNDASVGGRIFGYLEPAAPGPWFGKLHVGMDIRQPFNNPIYALTDGTIYDYFTDEGPRFNAIVVEFHEATGRPFYAVYGHSRLLDGLVIGSPVLAGQIIGYVNESMNQHTHLGLKMDPNFDTGWGYLDASIDPVGIGWRPPRTWLLAHAPFNTVPQPDTIPPIISLTGPKVNTRFTTFQQISWNAADDESGLDTVTLQWDAGTPTPVSASGTLLIPNGTHTVTIMATDLAGNTWTTTGGPYILAVPNMVVTSPGNLFEGSYYIQKSDRSSGLVVYMGLDTPPTFAIGDRVMVQSGTLTTIDGGTVLQNAVVSKVSGGAAPSPLDVSVRTATSGTSYNGRLIRIRGRVNYREPDGTFFYINDGTGRSDGFHTGIRVMCNDFADGSMLAMPALNRTVSITGIRWRLNVQDIIVPTLRPRFQTDIR